MEDFLIVQKYNFNADNKLQSNLFRNFFKDNHEERFDNKHSSIDRKLAKLSPVKRVENPFREYLPIKNDNITNKPDKKKVHTPDKITQEIISLPKTKESTRNELRDSSHIIIPKKYIKMRLPSLKRSETNHSPLKKQENRSPSSHNLKYDNTRPLNILKKKIIIKKSDCDVSHLDIEKNTYTVKLC
jgi:hypothetical protein